MSAARAGKPSPKSRRARAANHTAPGAMPSEPPPTPPREPVPRPEQRETFFLALALFSLFVVPWGPAGATGVRWSWNMLSAHPLESVPAILGPFAALVLVLSLRFADARSRDLMAGLLGLVLLSAGLSEASTLFAARGLGPALLLAGALCAVSHRLRLHAEAPRLARLLPLCALAVLIVHYLWPIQDGTQTVLRVELFWRFGTGATTVPQGALAAESLLLYYPVLFVGSAVVALLRRPVSGMDRFLAFAHAWGLPTVLLVASAPHFMYMPPSHATGFLSVAIAIAAATQLVLRGGARAVVRAGRGEYAEVSARPFFTRAVLAGLGGLGLVFGFPLFDQPHLAWFALIPTLFIVVRATTPRKAFLWAWWTGIVANFGCFYWVGDLLVEFALLPYPIAVLVAIVLAAYTGLVFGLWGYLVRRLHGRTRLPLPLLAAVLFTGVEFLWWELFPWYVGNSQYLFLPIIQIADITGVSGITFLVAFVGFAVHAWLSAVTHGAAFPRRTVLAAVAALAVCVSYGYVRIEMITAESAKATKLKVGVAQADVRIKESKAAYDAKLIRQERQVRDLAARGADLVVLPESSLPYTFRRTLKRAPELTASFGGVPVVFGASSVDKDERQYNTAFLLERDGSFAGRYDKNYPLPFGEYLPFMDKPWMQWVRDAFPYASFLSPGSEVEVFNFRGHRLGIMICYEDILPRYTRRLSDKHPNLLLNLTNDAWFAGSAEPAQHMALSVLRAVENRLYLVRSVRTGISGFIDATGRIYARTPQQQPATLLEEAAVLSGETIYRSIGDVFAYLVLAAAAFAVFESIRRTRRERA